MKIVVYVCPTKGCGNYYGSSSQAHLDLAKEENLQSDLSHTQTSWGQVVGHRSDCPDCKQNGRGTVERQRVSVDLSRVISAA